MPSDDAGTILSGEPAANPAPNGADPGATPPAPQAPDGPGTPPAPNGSGPAPNGSEPQWWQSFAEGFDKSEAMSWRNIASRYKEPTEFAKAHIEMRKNFDARIPVPGQDAKPEEWEKVWERLGRPKEPKEYKWTDPTDFQLDDTDKAYRDAMSMVFHRAGLNQQQLSTIENAHFEQLKLINDARAAARGAAPEKTKAVLKEVWGADKLDANLNMANTAVIHYGGSKSKDIVNITLADGTSLGSHPAFIEMMARIGKDRAEDDRDPTPFNVGARESAQQEIERIEAEALKAGYTPTHPQWPHKQLDALYQRAYGTRNMGAQPFGKGA